MKCVKGNPDRQKYVKQYGVGVQAKYLKNGLKLGREKVVVFKNSQNAQVVDDA